MSEATTLTAAKRERLGTAECRRLRREGMVPGNLYGHGEGAVSFKIDHDDVFKMVHDGHIAIDLDIDGKVDKAVFKEVQWDTFGKHIVHIDLIRVAKPLQENLPYLVGIATQLATLSSNSEQSGRA